MTSNERAKRQAQALTEYREWVLAQTRSTVVFGFVLFVGLEGLSAVIRSTPGVGFSFTALQVPIPAETVFALALAMLAFNLTIALAPPFSPGIAAPEADARSAGRADVLGSMALAAVTIAATVRPWKDDPILRAEQSTRLLRELDQVDATIATLRLTRSLAGVSSRPRIDRVRWFAGQVVALTAPCWVVLAVGLFGARLAGQEVRLSWAALSIFLALTLVIVGMNVFAGMQMLVGRRGAEKEGIFFAALVLLLVALTLASVGLGIIIAAQGDPGIKALLAWVVSMATIPPALLVYAAWRSRWKGPGKLVAAWAAGRLSRRQRVLRRELTALRELGDDA